MERLIIVGSPREKGRCASLAAEMFEACIEDCPDDGVAVAPVSTLSIAPCTGCDSCRNAPAASADAQCASDDFPQGYGACAGSCVIDDDMSEVRELLDGADELTVIAPLYFSGPPAQMKALIDRLQPYFWARERLKAAGEPLPEKRPLVLHIVGEGGDPHGFGPLVGIVRSAFACADFEVVRVMSWVGKIDADGTILADADDVTDIACGAVPAAGSSHDGSGADTAASATATEGSDESSACAGDADAAIEAFAPRGGERPKLKLDGSSKRGKPSERRKGKAPSQKGKSARGGSGGRSGHGRTGGKGGRNRG